MYRFFLRLYFFDEARARDSTQDLFVKVLEKPGLFDTTRVFSTWLYSVATNLFRNEIRNEKRRREILSQRVQTEHSVWPEMAGTMDRAVFDRAFQEVFEKLNTDQQLLITLRFQHEHSVVEIASILGIAEGTVKSRLFYLTKMLAEQMKAYNPM